MNLLIEELALRCKEYKLQADGARVDFDYKKFAELIVRECAKILENDDGATPDSELLFEYFGVE